MKCIEEGHIYKLDNLQTSQAQEVVFLKRTNGELVYDGTTNEEVLVMLIDRIKFLNTKCPCRENSIVITKLEESLMWLNKRTELRVAQGVETFDKAHKS
jgi:hypothetical protein